MAGEVTVENENNFKAALVDGINLFLGSGFSILSEDYRWQKSSYRQHICR